MTDTAIDREIQAALRSTVAQFLARVRTRIASRAARGAASCRGRSSPPARWRRSSSPPSSCRGRRRDAQPRSAERHSSAAFQKYLPPYGRPSLREAPPTRQSGLLKRGTPATRVGSPNASAPAHVRLPAWRRPPPKPEILIDPLKHAPCVADRRRPATDASTCTAQRGRRRAMELPPIGDRDRVLPSSAHAFGRRRSTAVTKPFGRSRSCCVALGASAVVRRRNTGAGRRDAAGTVGPAQGAGGDLAVSQGEKKISSMPYTLSVTGSHPASGWGRSSRRHGVAGGPSARRQPPDPVQYQDVGTNIDCDVKTLDEGASAGRSPSTTRRSTPTKRHCPAARKATPRSDRSARPTRWCSRTARPANSPLRPTS